MAKKQTTRKPRPGDLAGGAFSEIKRVAIAELQPDPENPMRHGEENLAAIERSLRDLGQYRPAIVNSRNGQVVVGNGMMEAAKRIGWTNLEVRFVDLTPAQQRKLAILDNRTAEMADWDDALLLAQLTDLAGDDPGLADALLLSDLLAAGPEDSEHVEFDASAEGQPVPDTFEVVVECADETQQKTLYERFKKEGLKCRLLTL